MKQVSFNIDEFAFFSDMYEDTDHLNENEIEHITGDNIFLAFINTHGIAHLNMIASINGKIYNFNLHKYLDEKSEILYAKPLSDIMPSDIWRLVHITDYDLISIDIDDDKYYLIDEFDENYYGKIDKNAKTKVLRNGYKTS